MNCKKRTVTSEYVAHGHPDKLADLIADSILQEIYFQDRNARTGIEVMVKDNTVVLGGEITTTAKVDYETVVRSVFNHVVYPDNHHLTPDNIKIINLIGEQSPEISAMVDKKNGVIGAGDQGFAVGYASNETPSYLPLGVYVAKTICQRVAGTNYPTRTFGPDAKTQVVVEYDDKGEPHIAHILVSVLHTNYSLEDTRKYVMGIITNNDKHWMDDDVYDKYFRNGDIIIEINPYGEWKTGGPIADCGVTGRKIVVDQYGGYANVGGGAFCVDGDTEYIGEDLKWHKIKDYVDGKVGQWNNGILEFVTPSKYHVNPSEKMYHFTSPNSIDMVLSENHDIVALTSKGNIHKVKVSDVLTKMKNNESSFKDNIPCTFEFINNNAGVDLTDDQIRLQIAVCADGTYKSMPGNKCRINIKKKKKVERLEWLLKRTDTEYHLLDKGDCHNKYYTFEPPVPNNKSLYDLFHNANTHQMMIIAKEVVKWDGDEVKGVFRTTSKEDADFIQFVFSCIYGNRSTINVDDRIGRKKTMCDKEYTISSITYEVSIGKTKTVSFAGSKSKVDVHEYKTDNMYCFTVDSGMLLLRRNNKIFVTGNCGKDMSKVDRSAAYMARYIAKNIVASGFCNEAKVELSYIIGKAEPCAFNIEMNKNCDLVDHIKRFFLEELDLSPKGIIDYFGKENMKFSWYARYGAFGYTDKEMLLCPFTPWEYTDLSEDLYCYLEGED